MKVLVMNHSFDQDIESLREASPGWDWRVIDLQFFYREAMRIFPTGVTDGLAGYTRPEYAEHRAHYKERLAELFEDLYLEGEFDVFVAPSDSFFYLREARDACHRLGVPFLVVQKETTIADWNMEKGTRELAQHAPLVADHMTVCSERHMEYWLRAGAPAEHMTVTGQPRFDFYAQDRREQLPYGEGGQIVLFFSYLPDFYHPVMVKSEGRGIWERMLQETEQGLWELAREGYRVLVKPHPLQPFRAEEKRIRDQVGSLYGDRVFTVDSAADTRRLIAGSDVAIGFQSTVMFEAMVAGLPLVYTFWDPEAQRIKETLVPYHEMGDVIEVVEDVSAFTDAVRNARPAPRGSELWEGRRRLAEPQLGPLDGHASERTIAKIESEVAAFRARSPHPPRELARSRPSLRLRRYRARERAIRIASRTRRALRI